MDRIEHPDPQVMRATWWGDAHNGRMARTACPHPISAIDQYVDEVPGRPDKHVNLYLCTICKTPLALADPFGRFAAEG